MLKEGIEAQYEPSAEADEASSRVARRKARYADAIGEASSWKSRLKQRQSAGEPVPV